MKSTVYLEQDKNNRDLYWVVKLENILERSIGSRIYIGESMKEPAIITLMQRDINVVITEQK